MAFEAFLTQTKAQPKKGRRITYTISLVFHGVLLFVGVVYSFWHVDILSPPGVPVTFMSAAAPPPPPPPPPKKKAVKPTPKPIQIVQPRVTQIVQPKEVVKEEKPDEDDGVEGGVEGGVAGGVVGAVPTAAPAGPPKFLPPSVTKGQLAIDPQSEQYKVHLPPALARAGMILWSMVKVCTDKDGQVQDVKIMKGADPTVDPLIVSKLKTWRYRPYKVDGRPVPFCTTVRYELSAN